MKRAIITGATGAIGTALIDELLSNDIEIMVVTRKESKRNSVIPLDSRIIVKYADRFYPSSKRCSRCGNIKEDLRLKDRIYNCNSCGLIIDRDLNAAKNLAALA